MEKIRRKIYFVIMKSRIIFSSAVWTVIIILQAIFIIGCNNMETFAKFDEMQAKEKWGNSPPFSFIYDGLSSDQLLKTWQLKTANRKLDKNRTERTLEWKDPKTGLEVACVLIEYSDFPAVEWVLSFTNTGKVDSPILEHILPLDAHLPPPVSGNNFVLHHSRGEHNSALSFAPVDTPVTSNAVVLSPCGGRSSDGEMPFFNLDSGNGGIVVAIGWSGQWEARFALENNESLHAQAGQQLTHFKLLPGESVRTPRILAVFWTGSDPLRGNNMFRQTLIAHYLPRWNGEIVYPPICASVNNVDPDGSYEGPHVRVMQTLAERGFEVFWSDMDPQQWYPVGFPNGTGTWEPDPVKYPNGLKPVGEAAHKAGLQYLLWFEPERVHPGSKIDKEHPEYVMKPRNEWSQLFKLHDSAARNWLTDYINEQICAAKLDWLRWDFNIEPLGFWRRNDTPDRQGITEIRYIEGLYAMWDELRSRHPRLVIDFCASGGRRIDIEALARGLPLWHSDLQCECAHPSADQLQNAGLFRWVPMHGCGDFGYEPSYVFRSAMTAGNIIIPLDKNGILNTAHEGTAEAAKRTTAIFRKMRPYMIGDFYPLFPHDAREDVWFGYQFHRPDLQAGMAILFRREKCGESDKSVQFREIDTEAEYEISFEETVEKIKIKGSELANLNIHIPSAPGSAIVYYRRR